jgi:phosphoglucosamine mutase
VQAALTEAEGALNGTGRVLLRPSGTEPVLRVMVEGRQKSEVERWAGYLADAVRGAAAG